MWTRKEFLDKASKLAGVPLSASNLGYAITRGAVAPSKSTVDGWYLYSERDLKAFVEFAKARRHHRRNLAVN